MSACMGRCVCLQFVIETNNNRAKRKSSQFCVDLSRSNNKKTMWSEPLSSKPCAPQVYNNSTTAMIDFYCDAEYCVTHSTHTHTPYTHSLKIQVHSTTEQSMLNNPINRLIMITQNQSNYNNVHTIVLSVVYSVYSFQSKLKKRWSVIFFGFGFPLIGCGENPLIIIQQS